jgi:hypothetical protein
MEVIMLNRQKKQIGLILAPLIIAFCCLSGCVSKTVNVWGDPETGLILKYRFNEGQTLTYESTSELIQTLDVMGQIQEVEGKSSTTVSYESKGKKDGNLPLKVTVKEMDAYYASSQGEISPDASEAVGKSFEMILSPLGKELELIGIEELKIDMGDEGITDMTGDFQDSFPDLAPRPVKIGDSWTSTVPITQTTTTGETTLNFVNTYTLEGFETVEGFECVKIKIDTEGTYDGTISQQGMDLISAGELSGSGICYFAYKEGIFVKATSEGTSEGSITISSQGIEIPMTRDIKSEVKLIK